MTEQSLQAQLYPSVAYTPAEPAGGGSPLFGVCVSGGGSRALTCALGQLSGLRSLPDPADSSRSLLERADYLSAVSGGSWASVSYTFLPEKIGGQAVSDDDFLITPVEPAGMSKGGEGTVAPGNVAYMNPHCLGTAPQNFGLERIVDVVETFWKWGMFHDLEKMHWFWIGAVGEIVLKDFGLFAGAYPKDGKFIEPGRWFSLSPDYVQEKITPDNPALTPESFYTCRAGRPTLIVNTNVLMDGGHGDAAQVPVQATAVHTGIQGRSPDGTLVGGGSVESFAFTSTLTGAGKAAGTAVVTTDRCYSLCDIAGCSSAFYAQVLLNFINDKIDEVVEALTKRLPGFVRKDLEDVVERYLDKDAAAIIPRYNYWPLDQVEAKPPVNTARFFSDGGDLENTGLLGLLAQTDAERVIAFVNSETPMSKSATSGKVIVDEQLPRLFGFMGADKQGNYVSYGGMSPAEPMSYAQLFEAGEFEALLEGLYNASCGGANKDADLGTHPAAFRQTLTTVENPVANIRGGRRVQVLWVYNNRVNAWQEAITDAAIQADLKEGQHNQNPDGTPAKPGGAPFSPLPNFPYYATAESIYLTKEDVNMLAQLSAWNVRQLEGEIQQLLA